MTILAELNVDQITDDQCKKVVEQKLTALDGVDRFSFHEGEKKVKVYFDDGKINLVDIKQSIMEEGYAVVEI